MLKTTPVVKVSSKVLSSLHTISECDTVSAFHGIGKTTWLSMIQKKEGCLEVLRQLVETLEVNSSVFNTIKSLVCHMYRRNTELITLGTKNPFRVKLRIHSNYPQNTMNCNSMLNFVQLSVLYMETSFTCQSLHTISIWSWVASERWSFKNSMDGKDVPDQCLKWHCVNVENQLVEICVSVEIRG